MVSRETDRPIFNMGTPILVRPHLYIETAPQAVSDRDNANIQMHYIDIPNAQTMASYKICTIVGCACAGNAGNVFTARDFKGNG